MREMTDSERKAIETPLREYWIEKDGLLPKETRAFEAGFIAALDFRQVFRTAALVAERDGLAAERDGLREQSTKLLAYILGNLSMGEIEETIEIMRRALSDPPTS